MVEDVLPTNLHEADGDELAHLRNELTRLRQGMRRLGHDLRNPLNVIMAYSQLLDQSPLQSQSLAGFQDQLRTATRQVFDVLDEIITTSDPQRSDAHAHGMKKQVALCMQSTLQEALNMMQMQGLHYQLENTLPHGQILAPKSWVIEVLLNVFSNAMKHGIDGHKVKVATQTVRVQADATLHCVIVENEVSNFISDLDLAFAMAGNRLHTANQRGHGLGIGIASTLMRQMGGIMHMGSCNPNRVRVTLGFPSFETR